MQLSDVIESGVFVLNITVEAGALHNNNYSKISSRDYNYIVEKRGTTS